MLPGANSPAPGGFDIDEASRTIVFARELAATPRQVFAAWTEPAQVARWWDPSGEPLARCEIDLRVGGSFSFVPRGHPEMPFAGVYREIRAPGLLVFDALGAEGRVSISSLGDGALMKVAIVSAGAEHLARFLQMGVAAGTSHTLDNLAGYLTIQAADAP